MSEMTRIHEAIVDGRQAVRDALDILIGRMVQSDDEDERRELSRAVKALHEAMSAIGDARHRVNLQKELGPQIVPMPYPYPVPQRAPWEYPHITWESETDRAITAGHRSAVTP